MAETAKEEAAQEEAASAAVEGAEAEEEGDRWQDCNSLSMGAESLKAGSEEEGEGLMRPLQGQPQQLQGQPQQRQRTQAFWPQWSIVEAENATRVQAEVAARQRWQVNTIGNRMGPPSESCSSRSPSREWKGASSSFVVETAQVQTFYAAQRERHSGVEPCPGPRASSPPQRGARQVEAGAGARAPAGAGV